MLEIWSWNWDAASKTFLVGRKKCFHLLCALFELVAASAVVKNRSQKNFLYRADHSMHFLLFPARPSQHLSLIQGHQNHYSWGDLMNFSLSALDAMMQCFLNFTLEREKNFSNLKMMMHLQWSRFNEKIANEKRPWRFLHPFVTKSKVKATQVFGFQGDFLGKRRGFSRVNFLPRHLVSVAASGFSGSVAVQGLLLILVQQPQQPQRLLLLYCRIYCWFNIEKLVSLSHTTKCFALSAALLGFDICHARGTLSCLLLTAVNTTVLVSFAYLHTQKRATAAALWKDILF